ncbi:MAG TPA: AbrB/MazE/SpoVT family DNA-binding domain-containing protein [Solirubrobacteraceae bacterium]|jgi:AbrB family looped-hinge helix DNA binding protein
MHVSIDRAGRVVIPKSVRDQLGFSPDTPLEAEVVEGRFELSAPHQPAKLVRGPYGPSFAPTGTPITDEDIRHTLEAVRKRG